MILLTLTNQSTSGLMVTGRQRTHTGTAQTSWHGCIMIGKVKILGAVVEGIAEQMQKGYNEDPECQILPAFPLVLLTNKRLLSF